MLKKIIAAIIIFFIPSYLAIADLFGRDNIIINGESPFGLGMKFSDLLYVWQDKINLGSFHGTQATFPVFYLIWPTLEKIGSYLSLNPSVLFVFLGYFLPALFFYIMFRSIFKKSNFPAIPAAFLYSFNIYRIQVGNSVENILLFSSIPLLFLFYYHYLNKRSAVSFLILPVLSFISATMGDNLAILISAYLPLVFYFIFFLISNRNGVNVIRLILENILLSLLLILVNIYWIYPQFVNLTASLGTSLENVRLWAPVGSGTFFDHFRYMGFWAFKSGTPDFAYFAYSSVYYSYLIIPTYLIVLISFFYVHSFRHKYQIDKNVLFILLASSLTLLLSAGVKGPTGPIYQFVFDHLTFFKIFREPYAKFMPLYIFFSSAGLGLSVEYLKERLKLKSSQSIALSLCLSLIILISAFPIFTKEVYHKDTDQYVLKENVVQIPEYWKEAKNYINNNLSEEVITIYPVNYYGTNYNWQYGANVVGNIADFLLNSKVIRAIDGDTSRLTQVIRPLYLYGNENNIAKVLSLINSKYILVENDVEWIYSKNGSPTDTDAFLRRQGYVPIKSFGTFSEQYLKDMIPSKTQKHIRIAVTKELLNRPALVLYTSPIAKAVGLFYIPDELRLLKSAKQITRDILTSKGEKPVILMSAENPQIPNEGATATKEVSQLIYKKISPTEYRLTLSSTNDQVPLVFVQNFDPNWRLLSVENHATANYYANYWLVNLSELCSHELVPCTISSQQKTVTLTLKYNSQEYFDILFLLSLSALGLTICACVVMCVLKIIKKYASS